MTMKRIAVFAGSFDPFTLGHLDIVKRASQMFDTLWVVVACNANKRNMFSDLVRAGLVKSAVSGIENVQVAVHDGLTVDFMKSVDARYLVRGIRGGADLEFEQAVAWNNRVLCEQAETVLLFSAPEHLSVSSSVVRELLLSGAREGGNAGIKTLQKFVPAKIVKKLLTEFGKLQ